MTTEKAHQHQQFGGQWTREKLAILKGYLDAYTTALKDKPFSLMYIDAFAGTGGINTRSKDPDAESFLKGSARIAIEVDGKPFDKLVFVENDADKCCKLRSLKGEHPSRDIEVHESDANRFLRDMQYDWKHSRGVLFLDPFATTVEWTTIEAIAKAGALDTWLLFPVSAIARMLPQTVRLDDMLPGLADRLTRIYGDEGWRGLYERETGLFDFPEDVAFHVREKGVRGLLNIYKENLGKLFGKGLLPDSKTLVNSNNSVLFEFIFCVGNPSPRVINLASGIAEHLINKLEISCSPQRPAAPAGSGELF